jgi:trans-aconitate 2-methyltransferase
MWDPTTYLRYGDERSRPFADLLARVSAESPREVVDLGCGPGTLTAGLTDRWPDARIRGLDSSAEMISSAAGLGSGVTFEVADVRKWSPTAEVDVVLANAVLQWVPGHDALLGRWVAALGTGRWLAFQVPGNFDAPSHRLLREVAARPAFRDRVGGLRDLSAVFEPTEYAALLTAAGCAVDAWETTYVHLLAAEEPSHPVLAWLEGTALRPVRASRDDDAWARYRVELSGLLDEAYPIRDGLVYFEFRRIFVVART